MMTKKKIKCKFCHAEVLFDQIMHRIYEQDGVTLHVDNCPRRKAFYKDRALTTFEIKRQEAKQ